jgi:5-formyltetrahydrofolate cyclo-ligase
MLNAEKNTLRSRMRQHRKLLAAQEKKVWDDWFNQFLIAELTKNAWNHIMAFYPIQNEPDLRPFMQKCLERGVVVLLPVTPPKGPIYPAVLKGFDTLCAGPFGTWHPCDSSPHEGPIDLILVPGLAFTSDGRRLGYGAGYYDGLLPKFPGTQAWGIGYPFQLLDDLPTDSHDVPLQRVLVPG